MQYKLWATGKTCSESSIYTRNVHYNGCDGWGETSLEECKQKCTNNEIPDGCPEKNVICKYVQWDDNPWSPPGWCQLADDSCLLKDATLTHQIWRKSGKLGEFYIISKFRWI